MPSGKSFESGTVGGAVCCNAFLPAVEACLELLLSFAHTTCNGILDVERETGAARDLEAKTAPFFLLPFLASVALASPTAAAAAFPASSVKPVTPIFR